MREEYGGVMLASSRLNVRAAIGERRRTKTEPRSGVTFDSKERPSQWGVSFDRTRWRRSGFAMLIQSCSGIRHIEPVTVYLEATLFSLPVVGGPECTSMQPLMKMNDAYAGHNNK